MIHRHLVARQQPRVRRHHVAQPQADDIARHQFTSRWIDPFAVANHAGLDRQLGFQRGDFITRLAFLPKGDHRIGHEQQENDKKIRPVPDHARQNHRHFNHPRNWPPKIAEEFQEEIRLLFGKFIRPVLCEPFLRLSLGEAVRRRPQFFLHLRHGQGFQIVLRSRFGIGLRTSFWISFGIRLGVSFYIWFGCGSCGLCVGLGIILHLGLGNGGVGLRFCGFARLGIRRLGRVGTRIHNWRF